jgi:hypothetical protein
MKREFAVSLLIGVFLCFQMIAGLCEGQDGIAEISIDTDHTSYELVSTEKIGQQTIAYYKISITLQNTGDVRSNDITLNVVDDGGFPFLENYTFNPGESKTFIMNNWPLEGLGAHNLTINFFPTNESRMNPHNHGTMTYVVSGNSPSDGSSTPGFELIVVLVAVLLAIFLYRKK